MPARSRLHARHWGGGGRRRGDADVVSANRAVFLDRDGTLIEEVGYLDRVDRVELYPWSIDAVRLLNRAGLRVIVVTNQSGIARGFFTEAIVDDVHAHISALLAEGGAYVDAYYYCPHHPQGHRAGYTHVCDCRKPARGLVDRAARELAVDPQRSFVVGDRWLDVRLARTVGARGVLVRTGYGRAEEAKPVPDVAADAVADNLMGATSWILGNLQS
jgi:D-glycero-D-manno-heptose 1,7-bisphosphate phosphatase